MEKEEILSNKIERMIYLDENIEGFEPPEGITGDGLKVSNVKESLKKLKEDMGKFWTEKEKKFYGYIIDKRMGPSLV